MSPGELTPRGGDRLIARRRALELLHAADVADTDPRDGLTGEDTYYARALVEGVTTHRPELDEVIRTSAEHWSLERMPVVDRNVLRVGIYELIYTDVPTGVIVDQAVMLAKLLSTEDSGRFVNGLLGRVARERRPSSS
ncbi:MAG TPA: transcription antitermination factor NusB [Actinomycetota bacterium]|nr:transcription antitermination factor NusB [Actinomycetota bacterium]